MSGLLDATSWAVTEFAEAALGDLRRPQRLGQRAHGLAQRPGAALPDACDSGALLNAASRFFANEDSAPDDMLPSHREATSGRLNAAPIVWAVPETTAAHWSNWRGTDGFGPRGPPACQGLLGHTTVALTPERVPLGLLAPQVWARAPDAIGKRARRQQLPRRQKERHQWLPSLAAVYTAHACCPTPHWGSVGDRAADVSAVRAAARPAGVARLMRAAWNRCVNAPPR